MYYKFCFIRIFFEQKNGVFSVGEKLGIGHGDSLEMPPKLILRGSCKFMEKIYFLRLRDSE